MSDAPCTAALDGLEIGTAPSVLRDGLWPTSIEPFDPDRDVPALADAVAAAADLKRRFAGVVTHLAANASTRERLRAALPVTQDVTAALASLPLVLDPTLPDGVVDRRTGPVREGPRMPELPSHVFIELLPFDPLAIVEELAPPYGTWGPSLVETLRPLLADIERARRWCL